MRAMRLMVAAALVSFAVPAAAQGGGQGGQGGAGAAQRQNEMFFKDITLTEAQKTQVDSIQTASRTAMREAMAGGMQEPGAREKMVEMRAKQMADIRAVLTAEQQVIFDKNVAAMPPMGGGRRPERR
jgi:Spy/CpxP family protein refolding chaperone